MLRACLISPSAVKIMASNPSGTYGTCTSTYMLKKSHSLQTWDRHLPLPVLREVEKFLLVGVDAGLGSTHVRDGNRGGASIAPV